MPVPRGREGDDAALQPQRRLLADQVFDRLRDDIVRGRLSPGQRVHDRELAARLGLSRSTVRGALLRLAHVGLVETVPGRHTRVTPIDLERYLQTQDTARALYVYAARVGTPSLTDRHIDRLRGLAARLGHRDHVDPEEVFDGSTAAGSFHVFLDALENGPLDRTLLRLQPHLQRVMGRYARLLPATEIDGAFLALFEAASRRDPAGVTEAMTSYYDGALATFHARLLRQPD